jgi:VanZ family protein
LWFIGGKAIVETGRVRGAGKITLLGAYMALLAWMSLGTSYPEPVESLFREVGSLALHGLGYFFLSLLFGWALTAKAKGALFALAAAFFYGLVLEIAQIYVPTRGFSGVDTLVNFVGSGIGALTLLAFWPQRSKEGNRRGT